MLLSYGFVILMMVRRANLTIFIAKPHSDAITTRSKEAGTHVVRRLGIPGAASPDDEAGAVTSGGALRSPIGWECAGSRAEADPLALSGLDEHTEPRAIQRRAGDDSPTKPQLNGENWGRDQGAPEPRGSALRSLTSTRG